MRRHNTWKEITVPIGTVRLRRYRPRTRTYARWRARMWRTGRLGSIIDAQSEPIQGLHRLAAEMVDRAREGG